MSSLCACEPCGHHVGVARASRAERLLLTMAAGALGIPARVSGVHLHDLRSLVRSVDIGAPGPGAGGHAQDPARTQLRRRPCMVGVDAVASGGGPGGGAAWAHPAGQHHRHLQPVRGRAQRGTWRVVFASSNVADRVLQAVRGLSPPTTCPWPDGMYGKWLARRRRPVAFLFRPIRHRDSMCPYRPSFPMRRPPHAGDHRYDDLYRLGRRRLVSPSCWGNTVRFRHVGQPGHLVGQRPQRATSSAPARVVQEPIREAVYARTPLPDPNDPVAQFQGGGFLCAWALRIIAASPCRSHASCRQAVTMSASHLRASPCAGPAAWSTSRATSLRLGGADATDLEPAAACRRYRRGAARVPVAAMKPAFAVVAPWAPSRCS